MNYGYDKAGRVNTVNGAGYAGVSNYASGLTYRAFGAIKGMNYANGRSLSTAYDMRLRPTTWNVGNVLGYNYNYDYFNEKTGRVSYAQNIQDPTLDRSYEYDHLGRLAISHSGAEARAHAYSGQWGTTDGPFSQGYDYDVWGNMTRRYGWGGEVQGGSPKRIHGHLSGWECWCASQASWMRLRPILSRRMNWPNRNWLTLTGNWGVVQPA